MFYYRQKLNQYKDEYGRLSVPTHLHLECSEQARIRPFLLRFLITSRGNRLYLSAPALKNRTAVVDLLLSAIPK